MKNKITSFFVFFFAVVAIFLWQGYFVFAKSVKAKSMADNNEILVKFKGDDEIFKIKIADSDDLENIINSYNKNTKVEYAEPNYYLDMSIIPNDTYYDHQWYLDKIKTPQAWDLVEQTDDVVIAIIDSGIQITHPDLINNIYKNKKEIPDNNTDDDHNGFIDDYNGWDFIDNVPDPSPKFKDEFTEAGVLHGTIVAGIVAAIGNNGQGVSGVSWKSKIMPLRVLDDKGEGRTSEVIRAIDYATNNGADIINLSFVGLGYSQALHEAIERAYNKDVIIVAAAGNEYAEGEGYNLDETSMYPVCHDGANGENMIIGVAATDALDQKAPFSSYGSRCIDILAPGVSIFSTAVYDLDQRLEGKNFNRYYDGYWSGTSMATPIVTGAISLIEQANPFIGRDKIIEYLLTGTDDVNRLNPKYIGKIGYGRLNIENSVKKALSSSSRLNNNYFLVFAPRHGYESIVKITDIDGNVKGQFFAYNQNFHGGVNVAAGDIDGDGQEEIITGAGPGGGPHVRIFDIDGNVKGQFFAYNQNFHGGVNVATGDVDGDGQDEIITGAGAGGGPQVRMFDSLGNVKGQFFAYNQNFHGGVRVASGNIDSGARNLADEIITSPGQGGGPHIRVFDNHINLKGEFFSYGDTYHGGVQIALGDVDNDGLAEIITGTGSNSTSYIRSFNLDGKFFASFYAFPEEYQNGVNIAVLSQ